MPRPVKEMQMRTVPRKLRTIHDLQMSRFGKPWPKHGLQLLYWFVKECIWENDDEMFLACDPTTGIFGFHPFENRCNDRNEQLLPDMDSSYYVVGNLYSPQANMLKDYVKKNKDVQNDLQNTDRIIVTTTQQKQCFGKIYATTHKDKFDYNPNDTFHISRSLLKSIQSFESVEDFLSSVGYGKVSYQMCSVACVRVLVDDSDLKDEMESKSSTTDHADADTDSEKQLRNCGCTIL
ncbi:uncharacterized protein wu:fc75a09 [Danio aesculapii]|uniref:uncharacterized protein wu:fc75a09 n=1 Tax=Danio aesculapii TaxID=1142201 RepID=UPI0024C0756A|nr:uncharacterized protein wu:fc75a09 [Danio aesculapii]